MDRTQKVDLFYDLVDEACMILYEELKLNYVDAFVRVAKDLTDSFDDSRLNEEATTRLQKIYDKLDDLYFVNEEVRLALLLLIIKGLKHIEYPLHHLIPDSVSLLFGFIIERYFDRELSILNIQMGVGSLLFAIANFLTKEARLIGIEEDELLVKIAGASANFQNTETKIYLNKPLSPNLEIVDCIVGSLENEFVEGKYLPYELIIHHLDNLTEDGIFVYLINNDFFNQKDNIAFKENFQGSLLGLIVLPTLMFQTSHHGKSILIGSKKKHQEQLAVFNLVSLTDQEKMSRSILEIENWIDKMKGINE